MAVKFNTEFNYRYQIQGETPWEKIKQLHGFLDGRKRAAAGEAISEIRFKSKISEIEHLKSVGAADHLIMNAQIDLMEMESMRNTEKEAFELNRQEIEILEKVLAETYAIAEPTRIPGYTDEQMYEINAANEFTAMIGREIYSEIMANGRASPAKLRNAMSNPHTMKALKNAGLLPDEMQYIEGGIDPLNIGLKCTVVETTAPLLEKAQQKKIEHNALNESAISLFATPLFVTKYENNLVDEFEHINKLEFIANSEEKLAWQTKDNFVLNHKEFENLKKFIEQKLEHYCKNILRIKERVSITQSWINQLPTGHNHSYHTHPNSVISGVFYFNLSEENPPIQFFSPITQSFQFTALEANEFTSGNFKPYATDGSLLIFPSNLPHCVPTNHGKSTRISLSFNTFIDGAIGTKEALTYLAV